MKKLILASLLSTVTSAYASDIILSSSIKSHLENKLEKDFKVLANFKFKNPTNPEILELMGLETLNATTAEKWLEERVNYIIEEKALSPVNLILKRVVFVDRTDVVYPNADVVPYALEKFNKDEDEGVIVMSNIGAGLYMAGKMNKQVFGLKISRGLLKKPLKVLVESPRVGIIQIGEGLFDKRLTINNQNPDALANSINRLGTFFHEARHSDGNAKSLSYAHSPCPKGHDFEGLPACDENLNGPYAVGAYFTKAMLDSCDSECSAKEKEILKITILDSLNRVTLTTRKGQPSEKWDPTPESL